MSHTCPTCTTAFVREEKVRGAQIEHCEACGMMWLDFSIYRPRIYEQLEAQSQRWQARYQQEQFKKKHCG
ncbi:hypothetical protein COW36_07340 [bacterium (Candidatus Blackallbacteria) CG17_big_fil_post_rev_8_21_14_2_50_48_46]|uniref:Transcription factor zinc-finger domain-containing protein n=1 Tax=bacterium (Candidatus Blackallbacteria) CG17_big_fil_post_rev_8_21_14_2_50_48_46 TaxID=2014261 RepID=A0A2M7G7Z0_9BACT|nr:MAG: hypothetical protein COW64_06850 [bacterium (Candidatus Blackallbacteria) CG18_big_fil_WC_8_21_14_2_50_49_26]PIW17874.1 MAG: hypothetical protein COW36_07340 [bacterium (Candidatus Blackallbacteria) CG17_big_fil_post_rev_8_21_14_2_50_48_46]PIW48550.1 MAG: hypothetical protein COW20_09295 [bacterium (Candidatus Blackallbacteria) CG13_big_fil_rev_8_21_14_2_50_49_14]